MPDKASTSVAAGDAPQTSLADHLLGLLGDVAEQISVLEQALAPINTLAHFVASRERGGGPSPAAGMLEDLAAAEPTDSVPTGEAFKSPDDPAMAAAPPAGPVAPPASEPMAFAPGGRELVRRRDGTGTRRNGREPASDAALPVAGVLEAALGRLMELVGPGEATRPNVSPRLHSALEKLSDATPALERVTTIAKAPRDSLLMRISQVDERAAAEGAKPTTRSTAAAATRPTQRRTAIPPLDLPPPEGAVKPVETPPAERMLRELATGQEALKKSIDDLRRRPTTWMH